MTTPLIEACARALAEETGDPCFEREIEVLPEDTITTRIAKQLRRLKRDDYRNAACAMIPLVLDAAAEVARKLPPSSLFDNSEASVCVDHAADIAAAILALSNQDSEL